MKSWQEQVKIEQLARRERDWNKPAKVWRKKKEKKTVALQLTQFSFESAVARSLFYIRI